MKNHSNPPDPLDTLREKLAGLGEGSIRKTYYPELQQRLEELERFKAFIDHSNDAMFLIQVPNGRIVDVNESASRQMGWSRTEFIEHSLFDLSDLATCTDAVKLISAPVDGGERTLAVTELHRKQGDKFPAELTLNRMSFQGGEYVLAVARDIQDRKHLEEQLLQSQKMEAIGRLAGGVAHDFNNILMVIMGYGNMLNTDLRLNEQQRRMAARIIEASEKGAHLTRSLLAFSRKQVMAPRMENLNEIVRQVEEFLVRIIGEDIQLKAHLAAEPLLVRVDCRQIEQVLINLATNARDAMPDGGVMSIETGQDHLDEEFVMATGYGSAGRYAVISMSDTGLGMDEVTRQRIFEPFFTTKELGKGTGLGMSIVYGIVKQHGGIVTVYSEPQIGTTFRIYLPLAQPSPLDTPEPPASLPSGGNETILVAEDEPALRALIGEILAAHGYQVILAEDGQDAVEKYAANQGAIGLVLMDLVMPRLRGKEASDQIRRINSSIRIAYISGYATDVIQERDLLDEGVQLIMKPIHPAELLVQVREILDRVLTTTR